MKISGEEKSGFITYLVDTYGDEVSRKNIMEAAQLHGLKEPQWLFNDPVYKAGRGFYRFKVVGPKKAAQRSVAPRESEPAQVLQMPQRQPVEHVQQKRLTMEMGNAIPSVDKNFVAFGFYADLTTIIKSKIFYPVFISGLSGNGKTTMVEQIAAKLKREVYRINISVETDEDSLIGGHTLVDGNVVFREGPALIAMKRGAILLLDEIDRGSNKLICLQAILEGKEYFNKKTGEMVSPAPGFNVIATANTKGQGSEDGKFSAAQILDEAFLERFAISYEQQYPEARFEKKIVLNNMRELECLDEDYADQLVKWAEVIRKTYAEGGVNDVITTRRLVHIVQAFSMFKNKKKAIELAVNRFDEETRLAFLDLFVKMAPVDPAGLETPETPETPEATIVSPKY